MKICVDTDLMRWTVVLHDVHLYMESKQMKYLFNISGPCYYKKYLLDINYLDFKEFIKECLDYGPNPLNQNDFEMSIIQIIKKYPNQEINSNLRLFLNKKLGNLILFNSQFKNFYYLKKLEKFFSIYSNFQTDNMQIKQNSQIKYLLILINNIVELKSNNIRIKSSVGKPSLHEPNWLDFIYDYYLN
jgi:hypothetical protein